MFIYGIGLPRTGTRSLSMALRILGYNGDNFCHLTGNNEEGSKQSEKKFLVDNNLYLAYKTIAESEPDAKFILTTRDKEKWKKSVAHFTDKNEYPDVKEYEKEVIEYFKGTNRLLVLDFSSEKWPWKKISPFLNEKTPDEPFPHSE